MGGGEVELPSFFWAGFGAELGLVEHGHAREVQPASALPTPLLVARVAIVGI